MKVVYILKEYPKVSESFVLNEIMELKKRNIALQIICFKNPNQTMFYSGMEKIPDAYYLTKPSWKKICYGHVYWLFRKPIAYLKVLILFMLCDPYYFKNIFLSRIYYAAIINKFRPDHMHAHFAREATHLAFLFHVLTGVNYTFTSHRYDIYNKPPNNFKLISNFSKKHITVSQYNRKYIINRFGVRGSKIKVIHCGIDCEKLGVNYQLRQLNRIIVVARLEKFKRVDTVIKACYELKNQGFLLECVVVGDGPKRDSLNELIQELKLSNQVKLLGYRSHTDTLRMINSSKVMVLASESEGIPVSLMEAMASKVAVIGPRVNGVSELIREGEHGFLVEPGDVEELSNKMKILLLNDALRKKFAARGYEKVNGEFNLSDEVDKLISVWVA